MSLNNLTILELPFMLRYRKNKNEALFKSLEQIGMTQMQNYVPLYTRFFNLNLTNWNSINLDHPPLAVISKNGELFCRGTPLFFKFSPILDPLKYITGSYEDYDFTLPTLTFSPHPKMGEVNNSSYVDSFFSFLSSELLHKHNFVHGVNFYGSYLGMKHDFMYNVEDEIEHLEDSDYFHKNRNVLFKLNREFAFSDSRKNKDTLTFSDEPVELVLDSLDDESVSESEYSDSGLNLHAIINRFPVQVIVLEKYTDTLDSILDDFTSDELTAALMQIIMTLLIYQKTFQFTHNDLHTNNIMFVETKVPFLYYSYNQINYKVPTYGKLFKIIDFGRSIYTFQNRRFVSDSFEQEGDAATQYNMEPFFDCASPPVPPNYSFDLCRLACCILESAPDSGGIYDVISEWCNDDQGESVLYTSNGDDRYPDFELYRMIARTVHAHTPEAQLKRPMFAAFESTEKGPCMFVESYSKM